jgi:hypothetical protein
MRWKGCEGSRGKRNNTEGEREKREEKYGIFRKYTGICDMEYLE